MVDTTLDRRLTVSDELKVSTEQFGALHLGMDVFRAHCMDDRDTPPGATHSHVERSMATLNVYGAEPVRHGTGSRRRSIPDAQYYVIALVALNILQVLHEEPFPRPVGEPLVKPPIRQSTHVDQLLDEVCPCAGQRDDA